MIHARAMCSEAERPDRVEPLDAKLAFFVENGVFSTRKTNFLVKKR